MFCSRKGQILVPSLMIFPALILFAILIVEVAKLSQQKILMQFAIDTSVFMEASQASDAANRLAYLNSPWPTRVMMDCNEDFNLVRKFRQGVATPVWKFFVENGAFPPSMDLSESECIDMGQDYPDPWQGRFRAIPEGSDAAIIGARNNANNNPGQDLGTLMLFKRENIEGPAGVGAIDREEVIAYYQKFYEYYAVLYQLASMVRLVYERLHGVFFAKTFWLNTGFNIKQDLVPSKMQINEHCSSKVKLIYTVVEGPWNIPHVKINEDDITPNMCHFGGAGLWQLNTVTEFRDNRHVFPFGKHYYEGPPNSFGVAYRDLFDGWDPYVIASAEVSGGKVWPYSKPTFQVRLRP